MYRIIFLNYQTFYELYILIIIEKTTSFKDEVCSEYTILKSNKNTNISEQIINKLYNFFFFFNNLYYCISNILFIFEIYH